MITYRYFIRIKKRNLLGIALRPTVKLGLKDRTVEMEIVKITDNGAKRTHRYLRLQHLSHHFVTEGPVLFEQLLTLFPISGNNT